ncbi:MAG: transposase family protein [Thioploca sp.]|nr:transposase family protein [Thioploca sp.]
MSDQFVLPNPLNYFKSLPDPRRETKNQLHRWEDIVMITLGGLLSGMEDGVGIAVFWNEKAAWLKQFLELPHGIPSHDTLSNVMGRLEPKAFREAFRRWMESAMLSGETFSDRWQDGARFGWRE